MAKVTYGTGSFVLANVGEACPPPSEGLLTTVAWDLGAHGGSSPVAYALEGAVFVTGAAVQWLRDGLGYHRRGGGHRTSGRLGGVVRGRLPRPRLHRPRQSLVGPLRPGHHHRPHPGTGAAQIARAVVEAMAFQVRDVVDAMTAAGGTVSALRVDGGASVMDLLLQLQADQVRVPVERPGTAETTALGAAFLAGLAEGVWGSLDELSSLWDLEPPSAAAASAAAAGSAHAGWLRAVESPGLGRPSGRTERASAWTGSSGPHGRIGQALVMRSEASRATIWTTSSCSFGDHPPRSSSRPLRRAARQPVEGGPSRRTVGGATRLPPPFDQAAPASSSPSRATAGAGTWRWSANCGRRSGPRGRRSGAAASRRPGESRGPASVASHR